jgi:hypothetical protein
VVAAKLPKLVLAAVSDPQPATATAAAKQVATYAATKGAIKEALSSQPNVQVRCCVISTNF